MTTIKTLDSWEIDVMILKMQIELQKEWRKAFDKGDPEGMHMADAQSEILSLLRDKIHEAEKNES